jgi:hypothetical protein
MWCSVKMSKDRKGGRGGNRREMFARMNWGSVTIKGMQMSGKEERPGEGKR